MLALSSRHRRSHPIRGRPGGAAAGNVPQDRHLPRSWAGSPGSILVSAASAGALTVTPVAASREARKWVSACSPALDAA
jgi:hypothetical protein